VGSREVLRSMSQTSALRLVVEQSEDSLGERWRVAHWDRKCRPPSEFGNGCSED